MRLLRRFCGSSVGKKIIMAITGITLAVFLVVHMLGNTAIYFGAEALNNYAELLHQFDPILRVIELALFLFFITHVSFGVMLAIRNRAARSSRYIVNKSSGGSTPGSSTMIYSGLIVLAFILYHLVYVAFASLSPENKIADVIRTQLNSPAVAGLYCVAVVALTVHLSHGLWSLWQSLGGNHPAYNTALLRGAFGLAVVMGSVFVSFPVLGIVWGDFLH